MGEHFIHQGAACAAARRTARQLPPQLTPLLLFTPASAWTNATMTFAWLTSATYNSDGINDNEGAAKTLFSKAGKAATNGATLAPNTLYNLTFDADAPMTTFRMAPAPSVTNIAAFMQHNPSDFEGKYHWLLDADGGAIYPVVTDPAALTPPPAPAPVSNDNDGVAYLASFIATLVSLIGVITASAGIMNFMGGSDRFRVSASAFASGALLFCAFSLIFPEALYKFSASGLKENAAHGWFAASVGIGTLVCIMLDFFAANNFGAPKAAATSGSHSGSTTPVFVTFVAGGGLILRRELSVLFA